MEEFSLGRYFERLAVNQAKALAIVFPLGIVCFVLWPGFAGLAVAGIAILIVCWVALQSGSNDFKHSFEGLAAVLSSLAIVLAGYWYFIERRSVPKVNVIPNIQIWSVGNGRALARVEMRIENVGSSDVQIDRNDKVVIEIGQVVPAISDHFAMMNRNFEQSKRAGKSSGIMRTDIYSPKAILDRSFDLRKRSDDRFNDQLEFRIEAGETERRYFKALVPCEDGLVSSVRVEMPKKLNWLQRFFDHEGSQKVWRGQAISNQIESCEKKGLKLVKGGL